MGQGFLWTVASHASQCRPIPTTAVVEPMFAANPSLTRKDLLWGQLAVGPSKSAVCEKNCFVAGSDSGQDLCCFAISRQINATKKEKEAALTMSYRWQKEIGWIKSLSTSIWKHFSHWLETWCSFGLLLKTAHVAFQMTPLHVYSCRDKWTYVFPPRNRGLLQFIWAFEVAA